MAASRLLATAAAIITTQCSAAPDKWIIAGSGDKRVCAGVKNGCTSASTCTYHAIGPCGGGKTVPDLYVEGEVVGMATVTDANAYLTDKTKYTEIKPTSANVAPNNGYSLKEENLDAGGAKYARITSGAFYGVNPDESGGYVGMASYVVQTGTVSTSEVKVMMPSLGDLRTNVKTKDVCISPKSGSACGAKQSFSPGSYKFSLFGRTMGSKFDLGSKTTHFGIRTKLTLQGTTGDLTVNGKTLAKLGSEDVTDLMVKEKGGSKRSLQIIFDTQYNVGVTSAPKVPTATKTVKIKVSKNPGATNSIFVDYLFEKFTNKDEWFMYDPSAYDSTGSNAIASGAWRAPPLLAAAVLFAGIMQLQLLHF